MGSLEHEFCLGLDQVFKILVHQCMGNGEGYHIPEAGEERNHPWGKSLPPLSEDTYRPQRLLLEIEGNADEGFELIVYGGEIPHVNIPDDDRLPGHGTLLVYVFYDIESLIRPVLAKADDCTGYHLSCLRAQQLDRASLHARGFNNYLRR